MNFSLSSQPWIPVLTESGMQTVSLTGIWDERVITLATGDDLEDAALTRLLLAIQIAADKASLCPVEWVNAQHNRFNLFDVEQPFWQNPQMKDRGTALGIDSASYNHFGRASTAVHPWHGASRLRYSAADAARILVVRQQFSVGGLQPYPAPSGGPASAPASVATTRPFLWLDVGRLSASLAATAALAGELATGAFRFSWPDDMSPGSEGQPVGVLDGLTWQSRSILLLADGEGQPSGVMISDGIRWPPQVPVDEEIRLVPYTLVVGGNTPGATRIQGVNATTPVWLQLAVMCAKPVGVAAERQHDVWTHAWGDYVPRWRLTGLDSFQAGVAGAVTGWFPVPREPEALTAVLDAVHASQRRLGATLARLGEIPAPSYSSVVGALFPSWGCVVRAVAQGTLSASAGSAQVRASTAEAVVAIAKDVGTGAPSRVGQLLTGTLPTTRDRLIDDKHGAAQSSLRRDEYVRRLAAAQLGRTGSIGALARGKSGEIDTRVIALIGDCTSTEYDGRLLAGKVFAIWHAGRAEVEYGPANVGIGRWAGSLGGTEAMKRLTVRSILDAQTPEQLALALTRLARAASEPADWSAVIEELEYWLNGTQRHAVRIVWAADYESVIAHSSALHSARPKPRTEV
jgi:hypothetical protein